MAKPVESTGPRKTHCNDVGIVFFQGLLYVLLTSSGVIYGLYTYNLLEDAWEDTDVQFRKNEFDVCDLLVSDNRLFLMTLCLTKYRRNIQPDDVPWALDISEVSLADNVWRTVVRMTQAELQQKFRVVKFQMPCLRIQAFGFDKSVLLMCRKNTKGVLYNFVTGVWEKLPQNPVTSVPVVSGFNHLSTNLTWQGSR